ncbi:MAG TPA: aminotransferase class V-fold PLP-dependent enzyme [Gammaproteobacteria bacterium]|nr:aminotransferase class V-fold PLP-dependent enzyme [Gammaproteobacteria bacterium]
MSQTIMQADAKVKLARECLPVTDEYAYLDTGSLGPISAIYSEALARCTTEDLAMGRALARRFERIDEAKGRIRSEVASLVGADPAEIELTRGTRDGIGRLLGRMRWSPGDEVVTTQLEFPACADTIHALTRTAAVVVRTAEVPEDGGEDVDWLERCLTPRTRLIAFSGVAYATGQRLPLDRIAELAAARDVRTLVDGAQLAGAADLGLGRTHIDFLAMPLQKWLLGPEGLGALYLRAGALGAPDSEGTAQGWPVLQACAEHLAWMRETLGWNWIHERTRRLGTHARSALGDIDGLSLVTPDAHAGLVAIRCKKNGSQQLADHLKFWNLIVRHRPELDLLRISTAFFNTEDEIDRFADAIRSRDGQSNPKDAFS